jgi:D-serine deaminase-like pyridoxal phosphate-dependent protein
LAQEEAMHIDEIDTPFVAIDLDVVEENIRATQEYFDRHGIRFRPHIKTHKLPVIAHKQIAAGAKGITCQKLGEAEVMAAAGIDDIFIAYNILGEAKLDRLMRLARQATMSVATDSEYTVRGLSQAAARESSEVRVVVEMDTGGSRAGVQTPEEAVALARLIDDLPGITFWGLMTYPTQAETVPIFEETVRSLRRSGLEPQVISGGGSACRFRVHEMPVITEHRAGTYVYNDRSMVASGTATWEDCAMRIVTTVVSRPTPDRAILDGGSKTFTNDPTRDGGYGYFPDYPEAVTFAQSEEHGHVDVSKCVRRPEIGERVQVIVNHACGTTNLHNEVVAHRRGRVEAIWPVAARGLLR